MRPRLLDLFSGAGGCSVGYHRAGFDVVGIDKVLRDRDFLRTFDVIHASPPCQGYTTMSNRHRGTGGRADAHLRIISDVRDLLTASSRHYVIENVPGAAQAMRAPVILRGAMFGLRVDRPRLFESSLPLTPPPPGPKRRDVVGVYGERHDGRRLYTRTDGTEQRAAGTLQEARDAMGIDWMTWEDLTEAIPPAYTEWIGLELLHALQAAS